MRRALIIIGILIALLFIAKAVSAQPSTESVTNQPQFRYQLQPASNFYQTAVLPEQVQGNNAAFLQNANGNPQL